MGVSDEVENAFRWGTQGRGTVWYFSLLLRVGGTRTTVKNLPKSKRTEQRLRRSSHFELCFFELLFVSSAVCSSLSLGGEVKNDDHYQLHAVQNRHRRVVIMSLGRSGSNAIASCIKHFAVSESSECCGRELFGGNAVAMKDDTDPKQKLETTLLQ